MAAKLKGQCEADAETNTVLWENTCPTTHQPEVFQYSAAQLRAWFSIGLCVKRHSGFLPVNTN